MSHEKELQASEDKRLAVLVQSIAEQSPTIAASVRGLIAALQEAEKAHDRSLSDREAQQQKAEPKGTTALPALGLKEQTVSSRRQGEAPSPASQQQTVQGGQAASKQEHNEYLLAGEFAMLHGQSALQLLQDIELGHIEVMLRASKNSIHAHVERLLTPVQQERVIALWRSRFGTEVVVQCSRPSCPCHANA